MSDPSEPEPGAKSRIRARPSGRDTVVIGASAGGIEALCTIVPALPEDLPAALQQNGEVRGANLVMEESR